MRHVGELVIVSLHPRSQLEGNPQLPRVRPQSLLPVIHSRSCIVDIEGVSISPCINRKRREIKTLRFQTRERLDDQLTRTHAHLDIRIRVVRPGVLRFIILRNQIGVAAPPSGIVKKVIADGSVVSKP